MNLLKKSGLVILLICLAFITQAQREKSYAQQKADKNTVFVAKKMDLSKGKTTFLHNVLVDKYKSNAKKTKDTSLSQKAKQEIYKNSYKETQTKLAEQFSKEEIAQINKLLKQNSKEAKK